MARKYPSYRSWEEWMASNPSDPEHVGVCLNCRRWMNLDGLRMFDIEGGADWVEICRPCADAYPSNPWLEANFKPLPDPRLCTCSYCHH